MGIMATRPLSGSSPDSLGHREAREIGGGASGAHAKQREAAGEGRERQCGFGPGLSRRLKNGAVECGLHGAMRDAGCGIGAVDARCRGCRVLGSSATMEQPTDSGGASSAARRLGVQPSSPGRVNVVSS